MPKNKHIRTTTTAFKIELPPEQEAFMRMWDTLSERQKRLVFANKAVSPHDIAPRDIEPTIASRQEAIATATPHARVGCLNNARDCIMPASWIAGGALVFGGIFAGFCLVPKIVRCVTNLRASTPSLPPTPAPTPVPHLEEETAPFDERMIETIDLAEVENMFDALKKPTERTQLLPTTLDSESASLKDVNVFSLIKKPKSYPEPESPTSIEMEPTASQEFNVFNFLKHPKNYTELN